ncbi:MAG: glycosyltransferase, partial [Rhodospirillaceae bacterium]|nr:glycosyltransferase [Rhodospirillaceae bacterium]
YKFISQSSVLAMTSVYEGFGNVLAEAQALGVPVVSTDCEAGPREILLDGAAGRLAPVGSVSEIAYAIEQSLTDTENTAAMTSEATRQILRFKVEKIAADFLATALRSG